MCTLLTPAGPVPGGSSGRKWSPRPGGRAGLLQGGKLFGRWAQHVGPKTYFRFTISFGGKFFYPSGGRGGRVPAPLAPPRPLWGRRHPFFLAPNRARENALFFQKNIRPKRKLKSSKRTSELRFPSGANFFTRPVGGGVECPRPRTPLAPPRPQWGRRHPLFF